jgi:N-acetylglucosaminyldiphosphoundecaprenol N-acetyl-beta-D-mannosaminyltransferase
MNLVKCPNPFRDLSFYRGSISSLADELGQATSLVTVATPNPEQIVLAKREPTFLKLLTQFDYLLPDGVGLVWASRLLGSRGKMQPIPERIPGVELASELIDRSLALEEKVLIIGGWQYHHHFLITKQDKYQVVDCVEDCDSKQGQTVHWTKGYGDASLPTQAEDSQLEDVLSRLKPSLVLVALGAPKQEKWIHDHLQLLEKNQIKVVMTVGGAIDMLIGRTIRAPGWVRSMGLEWFWRLVQEPWRWKRQLKLVEFVGMVGREYLGN